MTPGPWKIRMRIDGSRVSCKSVQPEAWIAHLKPLLAALGALP